MEYRESVKSQLIRRKENWKKSCENDADEADDGDDDEADNQQQSAMVELRTK